MEKDSYYGAGVIMALSLAHGACGPGFLSPKMYQWMSIGYTCVRSTIHLDDIPVETDLHGQLKRLQNSSNMDEARDAISDLSTFLECAGCTFPLRELNDKSKIVQACVQFQLLDRTRSSMERFLEGLSTLGVLNTIREYPKIFEPIFCQTFEELDIESTRRLFVPKLSPVGHNSRTQELSTLTYWNDYLVDINDGDAQLQFGDILMFATGTSNIPPCGFNPAPSIEFLAHSPGSKFPTANTCSCILWLPVVHAEYAEFKHNFEFAVLNAIGFGQA